MKQEFKETAGEKEDDLDLGANGMSNANINTNDYSLPPPPSKDQIMGNICNKIFQE